MRYAFIADIHSRYAHLERIVAEIEACSGLDEVLCLGDLFDAKVSKREEAAFVFQELSQVVDLDLGLIRVLSGYRCIAGNQEDRIRALVPPGHLPPVLRRFLEAPAALEFPEALLVHGHRFDWLNPKGETWYPRLDCLPDKHLLIYGHNHQNALFRLEAGPAGVTCHKVAIPFGEPIQLSRQNRYLVNVGDVRRVTPSWVLYDGTADTLTYYRLPERGQI